MNNSHLFRAFSNKSFLFLWLAEIFSQISMNMVNFVLLIFAYKLSNSNAAVSGIVLSFTIPAIIFGLIAGVYVDRWNKKNVLLITNILRAGLVFVLAFYHSDLLLIYSMTFLISIVSQFFIPAETPMIPVLVEKRDLLSANALFGLGIYGSIFIAYLLATALIFLKETSVFYIIAFLFLIAAVFILLIKEKTVNKKEQVIETSIAQPWTTELKAVLQIVLKTREIYSALFLLSLSQILILIIGVIGPGYASKILHIPLDSFPLFFVAPAAVGLIVGAFFVGNILHSRSRTKSAAIGVFLAAIAMILLPYGSKATSSGIIHFLSSFVPFINLDSLLYFVVFLAFMLGFANALVFVPSNTVLQEQTSDEIRGKIYGSLNALVGLLSLFPIIIVGALSDAIGVGEVITGIGLTILFIGIIQVVFVIKDFPWVSVKKSGGEAPMQNNK